MRLQLHLSSYSSELKYNYNYSLSSAIYKLLRFGSPEFASFLHDIGFMQDGRTYKLFSFALVFNNALYLKERIELKDRNVKLVITSPLIESFVQNFIIGSFTSQKLILTFKNSAVEFFIQQIESLPEPQITSPASFKLLSPLVLSTASTDSSLNKQYYLRPQDQSEINRVLSRNLLNKYKIINNKTLENAAVALEWDQDYLARHSRVTKKITINENGINPIDVIGIQAPFKLTGNAELIKTGYECGFGEKNSMGFGLAELINS